MWAPITMRLVVLEADGDTISASCTVPAYAVDDDLAVHRSAWDQSGWTASCRRTGLRVCDPHTWPDAVSAVDSARARIAALGRDAYLFAVAKWAPMGGGDVHR